MPITFDFTALVVRWDALEAHYPGGVKAFCARHRYYSWDWYLVGLNRKTCENPAGEAAHLVEHGVPEDSIALLDEEGRLLEPREWLEFGESRGMQAVWLKEEAAPVVTKPDGTVVRSNPKEAGGLTLNLPGTPLPDWHPFKKPRIILLPRRKD